MAAGEQILQVLARIEAKLDQLLAQPAAPVTGQSVADDADLDSQWGDEEVKDPPRWKGASHSGKRMSGCTPEFLDVYADFKDWCASRDEKINDPKKQKNAGYDRRRAAKARGWARRIRAGWKPPVSEPVSGGGFEGKSEYDDSGFTAPGDWT
jgi:hypothetical protein